MLTLIGIISLAGFVIFNLSIYLGQTPGSAKTIKPCRLAKSVGTFLYGLAYGLAILRLPFAIIPYLFKLLIFITFRTSYKVSHNNYAIELVRLAGDGLNLLLTGALLAYGFIQLGQISFLWYLIVGAEIVRLYCEKGQMLVSAFWQKLPHRKLAEFLIRSGLPAGGSWLNRYCTYYDLSQSEQMAYLLGWLKEQARHDPEMLNKLNYVNSFKIVPNSYGLRGGKVRDIARGEIFIHAGWTNDPWLLIGQALRRSPWIFDPRYLRRPFYYRSESNRLATLFVLQHARYCLPYALYQFGHEIKAARYDLLYRLARLAGYELEEKVLADGTFRFEQFIGWLDKQLGKSGPALDLPFLCSEEELLAELAQTEVTLSALEIAQRYTLPLKYVEEVLLIKMVNRNLVA